MSGLLVDLGIVLVFVLIGGFFAASEMALVSLREGQIRKLAQTRPKQGGRLERLARDPNRFLAAVQVGVTLAGFLSAGFGASRITPSISPWFEAIGLGPALAETITFILVTVLIAYLSLVLGELAPKRLALQRSEGIALRVGGIIDWVARVSRPFIWLLSVSTDAVVKVLGGDPTVGREHISEDELRGLVASHADLSDAERELIDDVFAAGDRELREVMIPRTEVDFLDHDLSVTDAVGLIARMPHSRYPVIRENADDVIGFVHVRDLFDPGTVGETFGVGELARDVLHLPSSKRVIPALTEMRDSGFHLAIVVDEYGGTDGIVTMEDLVEELVGDIRDEYDDAGSPRPIHPVAESWEADGLMNLDDFADESGYQVPDGPYETIAGYVIHLMGRVPRIGARVADTRSTYTVTGMDGRRIASVRIDPLLPEPPPEHSAE